VENSVKPNNITKCAQNSFGFLFCNDREFVTNQIKSNANRRSLNDTNPFVVRMMGVNINRRTVDNVHKVQNWLARQGCQTLYISPGSPWENAYIESFIGKFRKECVDRYLFYTLEETRIIIETWREEYNQYRPHSALDNLSPTAFAAQHS